MRRQSGPPRPLTLDPPALRLSPAHALACGTTWAAVSALLPRFNQASPHAR